MHELPITQSIINICLEEAVKYKASKVNEIRLRVGKLSGLVPDCIQYYFEVISKGTIAEGAKLRVEEVPVRIRCRNCGNESSLNLITYNCPECGSINVEIAGGREFQIESMEVE